MSADIDSEIRTYRPMAADYIRAGKQMLRLEESTDQALLTFAGMIRDGKQPTAAQTAAFAEAMAQRDAAVVKVRAAYEAYDAQQLRLTRALQTGLHALTEAP